MPTGIALRDAREQLFAAAERILRAQGPHALTSRAVTDEAGCAKGVLHRHFADFDTFLAELILARIARIDGHSASLTAAAGTKTVADNLVEALILIFDPLALAGLGLIISRDGLRTRLREAGVKGVPILSESATMIAGYLAAERDHGRLPADAEVHLLATTLIGTTQLIFAEAAAGDQAVSTAAVHRAVTGVIAATR
jgi:AcrR family transcriptional regulator